jgi:hypothetical protein
MKPHFTQVLALAFCILAIAMSLVAQDGRLREPESVVVPSDGLKLRARLFYPNGQGPFPSSFSITGLGIPEARHPAGQITDIPSCSDGCSPAALARSPSARGHKV